MSGSRAWLRPTFAILGGFALCSCSLRLPVEPYVEPTTSQQHPSPHPDSKVDVWMHADTYHTGLVFPYPWLLESGYIPPADFGMPRHVVMSWGNTDAYSADGISGPHGWIRVLFTPTPSVMELIPVNGDILKTMPNQRLWKASFPADRGPRLAHFLNQCSRMDASGRPIVVRPSSWGRGVQVEGSFPYFIPRVCNIWSCQAIEALGGNISPWHATTADGLARQLEKPENGFVLVSEPGN